MSLNEQNFFAYEQNLHQNYHSPPTTEVPETQLHLRYSNKLERIA
jgi:hypothetical protein